MFTCVIGIKGLRVKLCASVLTQMKLHTETSVSVNGAQPHPQVLKQIMWNRGDLMILMNIVGEM